MTFILAYFLFTSIFTIGMITHVLNADCPEDKIKNIVASCLYILFGPIMCIVEFIIINSKWHRNKFI